MQAGFTCLESGLVRSKNSVNVAIKNFVDFSISAIAFWLIGFGLMFGTSQSGMFGSTGFMFDADRGSWITAVFVFQLMFCGTASTIISGAIAERTRFLGYVLITLAISLVIYPLSGHWIWGGALEQTRTGWLAAMGFIDFAGATAVHSVGGWVSLAAVMIIGPRIGRFDKSTAPIRSHNLPTVVLGVFLLWFGWFGFNGGSTLTASSDIALIVLNTVLAGASGSVAVLAISWIMHGRPYVLDTFNGGLAGLVAVTASANMVNPSAAAAIGAVAGMVALGAASLLERFRIDDVVGAVPVHGAAGVWGTLAVALFADPASWVSGLGRWDQFMVQATGAGAIFAWSFGCGYILLWAINKVVPLRVTREQELQGLNISEHGSGSESHDLLREMEEQRMGGDFSTQVHAEPHTEIGEIARQYNRVLGRVQSETVLRDQAREKLFRKSAFLELSMKIAVAANEADSVDGTMQICLDQVCQFTGWPIGHAYVLSNNGDNVLVPTELWHLDDPARFEAFCSVTNKTTFDMGVGLPGRVFESGEPAWINDVTRDPNFPRAKLAQNVGLKAGFAFPVLIGAEVVAVLEFFSISESGPDDPLLELMAHIGTQLGRVIERRIVDQQLRTAMEEAEAANQLKSEFLTHMSHELRTPLNAIIGFSTMIKDQLLGTSKNSAYKGYGEDIYNSGHHLLKLIDDLLDLSKIEAGKFDLEFDRLDVHEAVLETLRTVDPMASQSDVTIQAELEENLSPLTADRRALDQILLNLLSNAIKFTPSGGRVTVRGSNTGGSTCLVIADTGIGIEPRDISTVMSTWGQVANPMMAGGGGAGLGLPIVQSLVKLHGGKFDIESKVGMGTTATVTLPNAGP